MPELDHTERGGWVMDKDIGLEKWLLAQIHEKETEDILIG